MKATNTFFEHKRDWSKIKDEILCAYLKPYLAKVTHTRKPIIIADCFAGKGKFDDGEKGSPLLILEAIYDHFKIANDAKIKAVFIEKKYFSELQQNISQGVNVTLLEGSYEEKVEYFIKNNSANGQNLFLYVDPYGIKSIKFSYFSQITKKDLNTVELLLNFNTKGFLREACRLLKQNDPDSDRSDSQDLAYESDVNCPELMDEIAGGTYWRDLTAKYCQKHFNMQTAEEMLVSEYCKKLKLVFRYVVNIPIKDKLSNVPKYRMIFGGNHEDGLILMADNMNKRWKDFRETERNGQQLLIECDFPDFLSMDNCWNIKARIPDLVVGKMCLKSLLVGLIEEYGIAFSTSKLKEIIKELDNNSLIISRVPSHSKQNRPFHGMEHNEKEYIVYIERKNQPQPQQIRLL